MQKDHCVIETIAAQATPAGKGGVAIIRVSGPKVAAAINHVLRKTPQPRLAIHTPFYDEKGEVIDEGLALYFPQPHSFTGEDVLELHAHGGPVIVDMLLEQLLQLNIRLAKPGEFTERAFHNNKIDLTQAEAIADLIDASSRKAAKLAVRSLQGEFAKTIHALSENIIYLRTFIEAAIDFAEEEIDFLADDKIVDQTQYLQSQLALIKTQAYQGNKLREGMKVVIAGEPNVGKSSLLNYLSAQEVAIVTDVPGTTRDVLHTQILIDGIPLHIVDTAGLRASDDIVEQEGIKRAYAEIQTADLLLHVVDATQFNLQKVADLHTISANEKLIVVNKIDLTDHAQGLRHEDDQAIIYLSVQAKKGLETLKQYIKRIAGHDNGAEGLFLARRRHLHALDRAQGLVDNAMMQLKSSKQGELAAEDLRLAHLALCEITGEFSADDLLGQIFSNFCIGK